MNCENCGHPKEKHAFDIVVSGNTNPCKLSCMICFDETTEKLKRGETN